MTDYKSGHLAWIHSTKTFTPKYPQDYRSDISYYEVIKELYSNPNCSQEQAKSFWISDKLWHKQTFALSKSIDKEVEKLEPTANGWWFVTIGFNHDTWNIKDCSKCIEGILGMEWIISAKANFELYRENGEHPHVHFLLQTKEPKSKILEKCYRPLYTKKVVFSKNFIDVKPMMDYHKKYIMLDKQSDKMENVKKDIEWRKKNNIPDYEKKFNLGNL